MVTEIGWTHNIVILEKCKDDLERKFYIQMTIQPSLQTLMFLFLYLPQIIERRSLALLQKILCQLVLRFLRSHGRV